MFHLTFQQKGEKLSKLEMQIVGALVMFLIGSCSLLYRFRGSDKEKHLDLILDLLINGFIEVILIIVAMIILINLKTH